MKKSISGKNIDAYGLIKDLLGKDSEPVYVTGENGKDEFVILEIEEYMKLKGINPEEEEMDQKEKDRKEMMDTLAKLRQEYW